MRIGRTLPPAAAPIPLAAILQALPACFEKNTGQGTVPFEDELKQYFGSKDCFLVSSGKAALSLILTALQALYPDRDTVVVPAFTCYSVPAAIKKTGLRIQLCDLASSSLDFDKEQLGNLVSVDRDNRKILCVLVTHLFGCPADISGIREIVGPDIPIVEDAAQAMGEQAGGKKLGTFGDVGFFSLGRGKALSTMEGGVIITSRRDLAARLITLTAGLEEYSRAGMIQLAVKTLLTNVLQRPLFYWLPRALPFLRLGETIYKQNFSLYAFSPFQRRLSWNWLERLEKHRMARQHNIRFWYAGLPGGLSSVCHEDETRSLIRLPLFARNNDERDKIIRMSEQAGLGIMSVYPTPIHLIPEIAGDFIGQRFPRAEDVCDRLLTIPVHEFVSTRDNMLIRDSLKMVTDVHL